MISSIVLVRAWLDLYLLFLNVFFLFPVKEKEMFYAVLPQYIGVNQDLKN